MKFTKKLSPNWVDLHDESGLRFRKYNDGTQRWYQNGKLHRDHDLPAIVWAGGTKEWWKNGERHRDNDLPAVVWADGTQEWWKKGERYIENFAEIIAASSLEEAIELISNQKNQ